MFLNPLAPYFAPLIIAVVIATSFFLVKILPNYPHPLNQNSSNNFVVLDGIRGYLAVAVFIHHSAVWYFYLHIGGWKVPPSNLYTNLGQASVAVFFMITAFLFFGKLLNTKNKKVDWYRLYLSRILRIVPLYLFSAVVITLIVLILTDFTLVEPATKFAQQISKFLQFKTPDLNGYNSGIINAGVTWTLRWERSFYIALPIFALFLRLNVSPIWFLITAAIVVPTLLGDSELMSLSFMGGIIAAYAVRQPALAKLCKKSSVGVGALLMALFTMNYFESAYQILPLLFLCTFFIVVVCDNELLKIFSFKAAQFLSTISYSIYLLHGIVLFVMFKFVIGFDVVKTFSVMQYWSVVAASAVILILLSSLTYYFIELPFLNLAKSKNLYKPNFIRFLSFSKKRH